MTKTFGTQNDSQNDLDDGVPTPDMGSEQVQVLTPQSNRMNKKERSWVLYDIANSAFILFATAVAPIYYSGLAGDGEVVADWSLTATIVSLITALLMPLLGSLADYPKNKKKFLIGAVGTGVVFCAMLGVPMPALTFLIIYAVAAIGYNTSLVFYDAFLVDATSTERFHALSSKGYAWGYIGSLAPFAVWMVLFMFGGNFGIDQALAVRIGFVVIAVWWALFTIPIIKNVHQSHNKPKEEGAIKKSLIGLVGTLKKIVKTRDLLIFMLAFFFYIDGVHTIISQATIFGSSLGLDSTMLIVALVVTQLVAWPSALIYGKLAVKLSARTMLIVGVIAYTIITFYAGIFLNSEPEFFVLAICVGLFQGGIQAISRSYFGKLIPKEHANEYFGFFDIFGKYSTILGTFLIYLFTTLTGNPSLGILSIVVLFAVGLIFLFMLPKHSAGGDSGDSDAVDARD